MAQCQCGNLEPVYRYDRVRENGAHGERFDQNVDFLCVLDWAQRGRALLGYRIGYYSIRLVAHGRAPRALTTAVSGGRRHEGAGTWRGDRENQTPPQL